MNNKIVSNENGQPLSRVEFYTNINNLPEGEYFSASGYTDSRPYKVISETAKTKTLVRVETVEDPDFKPEFHAGGFTAHCSNQNEQTWNFTGFGDFQIKIRLTKKGWVENGTRYLGNSAVRFYDYNF